MVIGTVTEQVALPGPGCHNGMANEIDVEDFTPPGQPDSAAGGPIGYVNDHRVGRPDDCFRFGIRLVISGPGRTPVFGDGGEVFDFDGDADMDLSGFAGFPYVLAR